MRKFFDSVFFIKYMQKVSRALPYKHDYLHYLNLPFLTTNSPPSQRARQLEEPIIVTRYSLLSSVLAVLTSFYSAYLPDWAVDLPQHYPLLFHLGQPDLRLERGFYFAGKNSLQGLKALGQQLFGDFI